MSGKVTQLPVKKPKAEDEHEAFFRALLLLCREHGVDIARGGQVQFMVKETGMHMKARYLLHTVDSHEVAIERLEHDPKQIGYQVITVRD